MAMTNKTKCKCSTKQKQKQNGSKCVWCVKNNKLTKKNSKGPRRSKMTAKKNKRGNNKSVKKNKNKRNQNKRVSKKRVKVGGAPWNNSNRENSQNTMVTMEQAYDGMTRTNHYTTNEDVPFADVQLMSDWLNSTTMALSNIKNTVDKQLGIITQRQLAVNCDIGPELYMNTFYILLHHLIQIFIGPGVAGLATSFVTASSVLLNRVGQIIYMFWMAHVADTGEVSANLVELFRWVLELSNASVNVVLVAAKGPAFIANLTTALVTFFQVTVTNMAQDTLVPITLFVYAMFKMVCYSYMNLLRTTDDVLITYKGIVDKLNLTRDKVTEIRALSLDQCKERVINAAWDSIQLQVISGLADHSPIRILINRKKLDITIAAICNEGLKFDFVNKLMHAAVETQIEETKERVGKSTIRDGTPRVRAPIEIKPKLTELMVVSLTEEMPSVYKKAAAAAAKPAAKPRGTKRSRRAVNPTQNPPNVPTMDIEADRADRDLAAEALAGLSSNSNSPTKKIKRVV